MNGDKMGAIKKDDFKTYLLNLSDISKISLDAVKNRIQYIDNLLESFGQPPLEGDYLLIVMNGKPCSWFILSPDILTIGREDSSGIVLDDPSASRKHCQIRKDGDSFLIEDRNSQNGIFINGKKVKERLLCEGDIIRIGTIELIYINNRKLDFV